MDIDINSTSSSEVGGGGDVKMGTKGDEESCEGEELLLDNNQEINIDLQNYIHENNKNKEKANNKIKINNLLKIGVLNIRGLNDENNKKNKKEKLKNYIIQEGWDITGVNETKLNSNKGKYIYRDWKDIKTRNNSADDIHSLGSQLLICKRWIDIRTINYKEFTGYAQSIDLVLKGKENSIRLINVYLICNDKKKKTAITETVDKWIDEAQNSNMNLIVMGDFNERKVNQDNASKDTMFLDMIEEYNLIDIHTRFNNEEALPTWSNGTISTTIDFIYMSYKLINKVEIHEILNIEKVLDTDHKALTITLRIKDERTKDVRKKQESQNFMNKKLLKMEWENIANRVEENLIESPINLEIYNENTKYWSVLKDRITSEMDKSIKEKQSQMTSKEKYQTDPRKMTTIQRLKKKIGIIGEIENTISKWRKLKEKIENDTLKYGIMY
ncbi:DNase I-like protein [Rhizophagus irregularis]|uniref:DNase I-like protein n=1 Tax=Rhizophagus irregularis TaxID=588596 RepID=A0A2N1NJC9_9GLOM|nr:DNase I-like protein [Rhizophagus irregularis]